MSSQTVCDRCRKTLPPWQMYEHHAMVEVLRYGERTRHLCKGCGDALTRWIAQPHTPLGWREMLGFRPAAVGRSLLPKED